MRLIRAVLPEARQFHEAEVLLGGLLRVAADADDPEEVRYDFHSGVRALLLNAVPSASALDVLERVSAFVQERLGQSRDFRALLADPDSAPGTLEPDESPFAHVAAEVLERLGGSYARLVRRPETAIPAPPTLKIYLSYRRADKVAFVGRLTDRLRQVFGATAILDDDDDLQIGDRWPDRLRKDVLTSDVVLAVIGDKWLTALDEDGLRRIDDPEDPVRQELCTALDGGKRVIPLLVDAARMPTKRGLPAELQQLPDLRAISLRTTEFEADLARLIEELSHLPPPPPPSTPLPPPIRVERASSGSIAPSANAILELLDQRDAQVLNLLALCRTPPYQQVWTQGPELLRRFARLLLKQGHPTLALEVAARGLEGRAFPNDLDLMYCRALALVRSGNTTRADMFLRELLDRTDLTPELRSDALSLAGRIRNDLAVQTRDPAGRSARLRSAFDFYCLAHDLTGDPFPGINAATLALLVGQLDRSRELAVRVRDAVLDELDKPGKERDYWLLAILGEAYLLLGEATGARTRYGQAVRLAQEAQAFGDITAVRRQLLLLREKIPVGDDLLGLFRLGPVVVFAGHGLDKPGAPPCFPNDPALEAAVRRAIKIELDALETAIGYCSPGCGSDILFGELMRERDAELHLILPFAEDDFVLERLTYGFQEQKPWHERYQKLSGHLRVTQHFATTEAFLNDPVLYDFGGTFLQGLALMRAGQFGTEAIALVVQDTITQPDSSGLAAFVENWKKTGNELRVINLAAVRARVRLTTPPWATPFEPAPRRTSQREIRAILFADVAGFSGLPEPFLPDFFQQFLEIVKTELVRAPALFANTWGDGLYIVFPEVVPCADFALRLLCRLEDFRWEELGFRLKEDKKPGARIGLHTGPVFKRFDPVGGKDTYYGSTVSRASRIEPVTAPGCAFVSEQFAAALVMAPNHQFVCEYLGLQPLAKDYDVCPLYRLTDRGSAN